jgi:LacI family transcriptional regulator
VAAGINPHTPYGAQRLAGIRQGCDDCGWDFSRSVEFLSLPREEENDFSLGFQLGEKFTVNRTGVQTAVLARNDRVAMGMIRALSLAGVEVPRQVSIIGYDDADFAAYTTPPLSTIEPGIDSLIEGALKLLMRDSLGSPKRLMVQPRLIKARLNFGDYSFRWLSKKNGELI